MSLESLEKSLESKRYVCHVVSDPVLDHLFNDMRTAVYSKKDNIAWLSRKLEAARKEVEDLATEYWNKVETRLKETEKLPADYTRDKSFLQFDEKDRVLYVGTKTNPLEQLLAKLMN